jgi:hypothetical protein
MTNTIHKGCYIFEGTLLRYLDEDDKWVFYETVDGRTGKVERDQTVMWEDQFEMFPYDEISLASYQALKRATQSL